MKKCVMKVKFAYAIVHPKLDFIAIDETPNENLCIYNDKKIASELIEEDNTTLEVREVVILDAKEYRRNNK